MTVEPGHKEHTQPNTSSRAELSCLESSAHAYPGLYPKPPANALLSAEAHSSSHSSNKR